MINWTEMQEAYKDAEITMHAADGIAVDMVKMLATR
jgi:hypothetical protein